MPGSLTPQQSDHYFQDGFLWPLTILDEAWATRHHEALSLQYVKPCVRQAVGQGETATAVRGQDRYGHFGAAPAFRGDFAAKLIAFQAEAEHLKRQVYDNA